MVVGGYFLEGNENCGIVAYLDCIHELVSITFIVLIRKNNYNQLAIIVLVYFNGSSNGYRHACECRYEVIQFCSIHISKLCKDAYISQLAYSYCSYFTSNELTDKRSRIRALLRLRSSLLGTNKCMKLSDSQKTFQKSRQLHNP